MCKIIGHKKVINQCLSLLPTEKFSCPVLNYGYDKLSVDSLMKIFVAAQIGKWESYEDIEEKIRAYPELRDSLNLSSISGSQLSRRINNLPTEWVQDLFSKVVQTLQDLTKDYEGISPEIGRLRIVDSTHLKLPPELCDWAFVTKGWNVVKMHTRLVVVSEDISYPDKILPSTGNVSDYESTDELLEASDATYLMDRGYPSKKNLNKWLEEDVRFVVRIKKHLKLKVQKEREVQHSNILRDEDVTFEGSNHVVRLVKFRDEEEHDYLLMTTRWDLTAEQIMDLYRYRWMIETFFKWVKQHLRFVKIWSTTPQGIWNQMFLALIAYGLALIVQLKTDTGRKKTLWVFLRLLRTYFDKSWDEFSNELFRKKKKSSNGRQKVPIPKVKQNSFIGTVAKIKPQNKK